MVAQPSSRLRVTHKPYFRKRPSSCAITSGAQSASGTKPRRKALRGVCSLVGRGFLITSWRFGRQPEPEAARVPEAINGVMNAPLNLHGNDERYSFMKTPLNSRQ